MCTVSLSGHPVAAVQHLLAAKYLVELMGGPRHPELVTIYFRLVGKGSKFSVHRFVYSYGSLFDRGTKLHERGIHSHSFIVYNRNLR